MDEGPSFHKLAVRERLEKIDRRLSSMDFTLKAIQDNLELIQKNNRRIEDEIKQKLNTIEEKGKSSGWWFY